MFLFRSKEHIFVSFLSHPIVLKDLGILEIKFFHLLPIYVHSGSLLLEPTSDSSSGILFQVDALQIQLLRIIKALTLKNTRLAGSKNPRILGTAICDILQV